MQPTSPPVIVHGSVNCFFGGFMELNSSTTEISSFLAQRGVSLNNRESHKLKDFLAETGSSKGSLLGWMYGRFKKLLQEKSLFRGFVNCFKWESGQKDEPTYGAFWSDHRVFDDLSNYYGNKYRGAFVFNYVMGAIAVLVALIPVGFSIEHHVGDDEPNYALLLTSIEFVIILTILIIYKIGANQNIHHAHKSSNSIFRLNRRWHERWLEYRILAERFRYMEILYPIGIDPRDDGVARQDDLAEWVNAYFAMRLEMQKTERTNDLASYKNKLMSVMRGQHSYHDKNAHRSECIHHRLHTIATWMFYGTLAACAFHFVLHDPILTLLAAFFPAVAAAMHGIIASGEFSKTAEVSDRMSKQIEKLILRLEKTSDESDIRPIAIEFHNIVIGEALNWKSTFMHKNVPLA